MAGLRTIVKQRGGPKGGLNSPENINMLICNIYLVNCGAPTRTLTQIIANSNCAGFLVRFQHVWQITPLKGHSNKVRVVQNLSRINSTIHHIKLGIGYSSHSKSEHYLSIFVSRNIAKHGSFSFQILGHYPFHSRLLNLSHICPLTAIVRSNFNSWRKCQ